MYLLCTHLILFLPEASSAWLDHGFSCNFEEQDDDEEDGDQMQASALKFL